jgi:hypothetical protein
MPATYSVSGHSKDAPVNQEPAELPAAVGLAAVGLAVPVPALWNDQV